MSGAYIAILMMFLILFMNKREEKRVLHHIVKKKRKGHGNIMLELAKRFIEKDVVIYTYNTQLTGVIKEVTEGGVLLKRDSDGTAEIVNPDFIVRIREYPRKKNGAKKSVIFD